MLKIAYHPLYCHPLPEGHRFPMLKYELIPEQLLYDGTLSPENIHRPEAASEEVILWTHTADYWQKMKSLSLSAPEMRRIGFPLSAELIEREITIAQGTIDCALFALNYGVALNVAGGTHHAFADKGEGFCLLNDMAIAANYLLKKKLAKKILIIDLDVHQGNGTAAIFAQEKRVFTFSMHGHSNYPYHKEQSDLDIPLQDKIEDKEYLALLNKALIALFEKYKPDFVFYLSGVDVLATDKLGKLGLSLAGCKERDRLVLQKCKDAAVPVCIAMGGGYSPQISAIVQAHCATFQLAKHLFF